MLRVAKSNRTKSDAAKSDSRQSVWSVVETYIKRISVPLFGLLVCFHILDQFPQSREFQSGNPEIEKIRLKTGANLEVKFDNTYSTKTFSYTPLFQKVYGDSYVSIHHQIVSFLGEHGAVMYILFESEDEAIIAKKRTEEWWDFEQPMKARVYGRFLVRVSGPETLFQDFSESVFAAIEENIAIMRE